MGQTIRHAGRLAALMVPAVGAALLLNGQTAAGGGGCRGVAVTEASGSAVTMNDSCFLPTVLHAEPGATVSFTNPSAQPHTVSGANAEWGNYEEVRSGGGSVTVTFDKPGTYPYFCFVHPGMIGVVVVGDGWRGAPGLPPLVKAANLQPAAGGISDEPATAPAAVEAAAEGDSNQSVLVGALGVLLGAGAAGAGFAARSFRRGKV